MALPNNPVYVDGCHVSASCDKCFITMKCTVCKKPYKACDTCEILKPCWLFKEEKTVETSNYNGNIK